MKSLVLAVGLLVATALPAHAAPGTCVPNVASIRFQCSVPELDAMFRAAGPGAAPMGVKNGWVIEPPAMVALGNVFWQGKRFYPGGVINRTLGSEAVSGAVFVAGSVLDGRPTWVIQYPFPVRDEIREVAPGVYLGSSLSPGGRTLTFVLA